MSNDKFYKRLIEIENMSNLKSEDIPSLDLYMNQIMTLFDVNLADNKRDEDDKLLTETMTNNYSKEDLLRPIKGKKYAKDHILQMLLIYSLKNTVSIQEIKKVLQPYHEQTEKIEPVYNKSLPTKKELAHLIATPIQEFIEKQGFDLDDPDQRIMPLLLICALSNQYKTVTEKILDTYHQDENEK